MGGPVKTAGSYLFDSSPQGQWLYQQKEALLVGPLAGLVGTYGFNAQTDADQQAVYPASHVVSSVGVDAVLSTIGAIGAKKGVKSIVEGAEGFSKKVDAADQLVRDGAKGVEGAIDDLASSKVKWVDENAGMSPRARDYNDSATGARSNPATRSGQAPALERTMPDGSTRLVKFDGVDGNVLVDRKISVVTTSKSKNQALRQSEVLSQNGLTARWEVPTQAQATRAQKMFDELGIKNISIKVIREPGNQ